MREDACCNVHKTCHFLPLMSHLMSDAAGCLTLALLSPAAVLVREKQCQPWKMELNHLGERTPFLPENSLPHYQRHTCACSSTLRIHTYWQTLLIHLSQAKIPLHQHAAASSCQPYIALAAVCHLAILATFSLIRPCIMNNCDCNIG